MNDIIKMPGMDNQELLLSLSLRLYRAVEDNDIDALKDLIQRKRANPNVILPENGISSFHLAVGIDTVSFSEEVTRLFLSHGGDPNVRSCEKLTPVHVAAIRGRFQNLHLLLLAGGDPQSLDEDGCSPMFYAYQEGNFSCVELLQTYKCILAKHFTPDSSLNLRYESNIFPEKTKNVSPLVAEKRRCEHSISSDLFADNEVSMDLSECQITNLSKVNRERQLMNENIIPVSSTSNNNVEDEQKKGTADIPGNLPVLDSSQNRSQLLETWLASHSCFTESNEINQFEDGSGKHQNSEDNLQLSSKVNNEINILRSDCDKNHLERKVNKNADIEKKVDDSFTQNEILCSKDSDISFDSSVTNGTYDISGYDRSSHRTYTIFVDSILSSDRSSPVRNIWNIPVNDASVEPYPLNRCHSESTLSSISSNSEERNKFVTYRKNGLVRGIFRNSSTSSMNGINESEEYFTVPEEIYEYTDEEEGIVLLEKRLPPVIQSGNKISNNLQAERLPKVNIVPRSSSEFSLSSYNTEDLKKEVRKAVSSGCCCPLGPITATTKRVYLRKIHNFKKGISTNNMGRNASTPIPSAPNFSRELERTLAKPWQQSHSKYIEVEQRMMAQFDGNKKFGQWREGSQKSSFNYLLLDPRLTDNLPLRWANDAARRKSFNSQSNSQYWKDFLSSIFYVGKGKRSRPYSHLYEAVTAWRNGNSANKVTKKVKHILEIWNDNAGVVCLHVFQNAIPVEAFTREAAMIDAMGLKNLKNERRGDYYGIVSSLSFSQKREFGSFLLHRAMLIFLNEGERQIRPADID